MKTCIKTCPDFLYLYTTSAHIVQNCEYFINNGINVKLVELQDEDPSDLGFSRVTNLIQDTNKLNTFKLMEMKIMEKMV